MADPNKAAVGGDSGSLTPPNYSELEGDIAQIESDYEPRVEQEEQRSQEFEQKAISASEQMADEAERAAGEMTAQDQELENWLAHTPTRQASYATSMHAAPLLTVLTALGGKVTRLNGMQMLAATNGIVQGLNEASEQKYNDAMKAWEASYQRMRDHQQRLMDAHKLMLTAYQGRADAYQKASDAARRMTGDILDDKQRQIAQKTDLFKAQSAAVDRLARVKLARDSLNARVGKEIAQEAHWKEIDKRAGSSQLPAELKAQLAVEKSRWQNAKSQIDENMKRRGQVNADLSMPEQVKQEQLAKLDDAAEALTMEMNKAQSNADAILAGYLSIAGKQKPTTGSPGELPTDNRHGTIDRAPAVQSDGAQVSPKRKAILEQNRGKPVTFADNSQWIMETDGSIHQVQ